MIFKVLFLFPVIAFCAVVSVFFFIIKLYLYLLLSREPREFKYCIGDKEIEQVRQFGHYDGTDTLSGTRKNRVALAKETLIEDGD